MDIVELIGFLISFLAFIFLLVRRARDQAIRPQGGEEREQKERLRAFLKSLDIDIEEEAERPLAPAPPPPPLRKIKEKAKVASTGYEFKTQFDQKQSFKTSIPPSSTFKEVSENASTDYHMIQKRKPSRGKQVLNSLSSTKNAIILNEILNRPRNFL
ncbi:MAG: hypothetical protein ACSNEK_06650 [Parachlamydiaceae bacterium]